MFALPSSIPPHFSRKKTHFHFNNNYKILLLFPPLQRSYILFCVSVEFFPQKTRVNCSSLVHMPKKFYLVYIKCHNTEHLSARLSSGKQRGKRRREVEQISSAIYLHRTRKSNDVKILLRSRMDASMDKAED
jgi:hypothetical protein